jgi:heat shock protein HtpX
VLDWRRQGRRSGYSKVQVRALALMCTLLGVYVAAFILLVEVAHLGALAVGVATLVIVAIQLLLGPRLALWSVQARAASEQQTKVREQLAKLAQLEDIACPRLAVAPTGVPLAFIVGRSPRRSTVCISRGLLDLLDDRERESVLAHELAHVVHWDIAVMTLASSMSAVSSLGLRFIWWDGTLTPFDPFGCEDPPWWSRSARLRRPLKVLRPVLYAASLVGPLAVILLKFLIFFPLLASVVFAGITVPAIRALSRAREHGADRAGALLTGAAIPLATGLLKISGAMSDPRPGSASGRFSQPASYPPHDPARRGFCPASAGVASTSCRAGEPTSRSTGRPRRRFARGDSASRGSHAGRRR